MKSKCPVLLYCKTGATDGSAADTEFMVSLFAMPSSGSNINCACASSLQLAVV